MLEELKYLRRRNEELSHNDEDCQANKGKINQLQGELNSLREEASALHAQRVKLQGIRTQDQENVSGELPDINPASVHIRQPAVNGTSAFDSKKWL